MEHEKVLAVDFRDSIDEASIIIYLIHYMLFQDSHHIFLYLFGDIAFVPIEVLLVSLIIHKMLEVKEKKAILEKLSMLVGVFFSEIGQESISFIRRGIFNTGKCFQIIRKR
ncbi:hypothetical protein LCGC14_2305390 [marine sediment metagenome]|uniref:Uncharacterized protein n=1 Tax=marine sediment metagenome TaxID=412755 RepID=A0A0F9CM85_9ZZZZ